MKSRDMQIAEAVRDAIADACDAAARDWLKHWFLAEKNAAVACAGLANRIDLPTIIASVGGKPAERCTYCDGTGDVHSHDGEWRGTCTCEAGSRIREGKQ